MCLSHFHFLLLSWSNTSSWSVFPPYLFISSLVRYFNNRGWAKQYEKGCYTSYFIRRKGSMVVCRSRPRSRRLSKSSVLNDACLCCCCCCWLLMEKALTSPITTRGGAELSNKTYILYVDRCRVRSFTPEHAPTAVYRCGVGVSTCANV